MGGRGDRLGSTADGGAPAAALDAAVLRSAELGVDRVVGVASRRRGWSCRGTRRRSCGRRSTRASAAEPGRSSRWTRRLVFGEIPCSSAVARVNGLIEEPGWRWPWVARLKGCVSKSVPPTIALTPPVGLSSTTTEAVGATPESVRLTRSSSAAFCRSQVERRCGLCSPPPKASTGAVAVDQLLAQPGGEVGGLGVDASAARCRRRPGSGLLDALRLYSLLGDVALFAHVLRAPGCGVRARLRD